MKIIIAGGRDFKSYELLKYKCDIILKNVKTPIEIVSGKAKGADFLGETYAIEKGYEISYFPAGWEKHGKSAGVIRNEQMANYADALIAFWDGKSRGTKNMIELAKKNNLAVKIIYY